MTDGSSSPQTLRRTRIALAALIALFVTAGGFHIGALGIPSEEILPHLFRHPRVAADRSLDSAELLLEAPYDLPDGEERSGLVFARQWPVFSYIVPPVSYPILAEVWQSEHLSYVAVAIAPLFGGSIEGLRRTALLGGALGLLLVFFLARRLAPPSNASKTEEPWLGIVAAAWLATSVSYLFPHRTAYLIETGPPLFAVLVLYLALDGRRSRFVLGGLAAGLALSMKVTTGWFFLGMVIYLAVARRFPRQPVLVWLGAVVAALIGLSPLLMFLIHDPHTQIIGRTTTFLSEPWRALVRLPHVAWITSAYLGDPSGILEPLLTGKRHVALSFWGPAVPVAITLFSIFRVARRAHDRQPELLWLCVMPPVLLLGAWLYGADNPFQIALLVAPIYAIVVARALYALYRFLARRFSSRLALALLALAAVGVQTLEISDLARAHRRIANPMMAMDGQRELVAALVARGIETPLTTTYNSAGFYEYLSEGRVLPIHLYTLLQPRPGMSRDGYRALSERTWTLALVATRGPVVLPLGYNLFEGAGQDPDVVRSAFFAACRNLSVTAHETARFPADGPPAFGLYEIVGEPRQESGRATTVDQSWIGEPRPLLLPGPTEPPEEGVAPPPPARIQEAPAGAGTRAVLDNLEAGATLGELVVDAITEPFDGAVLVHVHEPSGGRATLEVRLGSETPDPPARSRGYSIYYRNAAEAAAGDAVPPPLLVEAALALAARMDRAPADLRAPPEMTTHPTSVPPATDER